MKNKNNLINKTDREFRAFCSFELKELRSEEGERQDYVHGVPVVFNTPTCLFEYEGVKFYEQIDRHAFGRDLLEDIRGGYIDKMSFAFVVAEDGEEYDQATHTRTITRIKKLYDVSAVDIPAYDTTSISARDFFSEEYEKEKRALEQAKLREICIAKSKI